MKMKRFAAALLALILCVVLYLLTKNYIVSLGVLAALVAGAMLFLVAQVAARARQMAAICASAVLIGRPARSRDARMSA